jgi:hypothetical protein
MESKLPEGHLITINESMRIYPRADPTGVYFTHEQLAERDRAIARQAFEAGQQSVKCCNLDAGCGSYSKETDDYLQSDEFKKLIGEI